MAGELWNKNLPDGAKEWRLGDDDIRTNNAAVEESLAVHMVFPGNSDANRGRLVYEAFNNSADRDLNITNPLPGMRVWLTDHRAPFFHDGNGWQSLAPGVGTLAERDAIASPVEGARWTATDDKSRTSRYVAGAWVYTEDDAYKDGYQRIAKDGSQDVTGQSGADVEISSDGDAANPGVNDFWLEDAAPIAGQVREIEAGVSMRLTSDGGGCAMHAWAVVLEDDVETARFPIGTAQVTGLANDSATPNPFRRRRYTVGAGTNLKVKIFAAKNASAANNVVRGKPDDDASGGWDTSLAWRLIG